MFPKILLSNKTLKTLFPGEDGNDSIPSFPCNKCDGPDDGFVRYYVWRRGYNNETKLGWDSRAICPNCGNIKEIDFIPYKKDVKEKVILLSSEDPFLDMSIIDTFVRMNKSVVYFDTHLHKEDIVNVLSNFRNYMEEDIYHYRTRSSITNRFDVEIFMAILEFLKPFEYCMTNSFNSCIAHIMIIMKYAQAFNNMWMYDKHSHALYGHQYEDHIKITSIDLPYIGN